MPKWMLVTAAIILSCTLSTAQDSAGPEVPDLAAMSKDELHQLSYDLNIKGQHEEASKVAFELFQQDGRSTVARLLMAYSLRGRGEHHGAVAYNLLALDQAGEFDHVHNTDAYTALAASYTALGMFERAEAALKRSEEIATRYTSQSRKKMLGNYQLACISSVRSALREKQGKPEEAEAERAFAVAYLLMAKKHGYDLWAHAKADLDLRPLHGYAMFDQLVK